MEVLAVLDASLVFGSLSCDFVPLPHKILCNSFFDRAVYFGHLQPGVFGHDLESSHHQIGILCDVLFAEGKQLNQLCWCNELLKEEFLQASRSQQLSPISDNVRWRQDRELT